MWTNATIERVQRCPPRIASVFLRTAMAPHRAGQHVDIRLVADDGYEARRSYSIASAPADTTIELLIDRLDDGEVSPWFHDVAQPGDTIDLRGPLGGHFVWSPADGGPVLWIAGGSGIAPLAAMARQRAREAPGMPALLLHAARGWDDLALRDEMIEAARRDPAFHFVAATSREPARRAGDFSRRVDAAMLADVLERWQQRPQRVHVCGSTPFVETVATAALQLGIAAAIIRTERYGDAA